MTKTAFHLIVLLGFSWAMRMSQAQSWNNIPFSATTNWSFNGDTQVSEQGWTWYLGFPSSDSGITDSGLYQNGQVRQACPVNGNPQIPYWYSHSYHTSSDRTVVWGGPLQNYFIRSPGSIYITGQQPNVRGIAFQGAFGGKVVSSTDTTWNNVVQAVYFHQRYCYDGGPEFGFYRLLQNPYDTDEETHVYFYYSTNTNCNGAGSLPLYDESNNLTSSSYYTSNCNQANPAGGASSPVVQNTQSQKIFLWLNSQSTLVYNYSAYLASPSCTDGSGTHMGQYFYVTIQDPGNGTYAFQQCVGPVDPSFAADANNMINGAEPGYVDLAMQKSVATDMFSNPLGDIQSTIWDWAAVGINSLSVAWQ